MGLNFVITALLMCMIGTIIGYEIRSECGQNADEECAICNLCSTNFELTCDPGHVVVPIRGRHSYCGANSCCTDLRTLCQDMTEDQFQEYVGHCDPDSNVCYGTHKGHQLTNPACGCTADCNSRMSAVIYRCEYVPTTAAPTVTTISPDSPSTSSTTQVATTGTSTSTSTTATTTSKTTTQIIISTTTSTTTITELPTEATSSTTIPSPPEATSESITNDPDYTTYENNHTSTTTPTITNGATTSSTTANPTTRLPVDATEEATTHENEQTTAEIGSSSSSTGEMLTTEDRGTSISTPTRASSPATATSTSLLWTTSGETTDWATTEESPEGEDSGPLFLVLGVLLLLVLILAVIAAICVYSRRKSAPNRSDSKTKLESGTSFVNEEYALSTKSPASGWPDVVPEKDCFRNIGKFPPHDEEGELEDYYGVAAAPHPGLVQQAERFQAAAGAGGGAMDAGDGEDIFSVPPAGTTPGEDADYGTYADASGVMTDEYDYVTHEGSAQKQAKVTDGIEEDYYAVSQPTNPHYVQHPDRFQPTAVSSSQVEQSEEYDYAYGHMLGGPMRMQEGTINPGRAIELKPDPASEKNPKQLETNETLMSENPVYG